MRRRQSPESSDGARLLVVNDDEDGCELVARLLERAGWRVERVHAHADAVRAVNHPGPDPDAAVDGVVVDFSSGGTSSNLKLLDSVRHGEPDSRHLPVVILAGSQQSSSFAYQSGADAYLVRPLHADELVEGVRSVLERSPDDREAHRRAQLDATQSS